MRGHLCPRAGYTLAEVLIVLALFGIIGSFTFLVSFDTYRRSSLRTERATLVALLQHARAQAMNNVCSGDTCTAGKPYGVSIQHDRYVVFQGSDYASRDPDQDSSVEINPTIRHGGLTEVVFASSSGNSQSTGNILMVDTAGNTSTTTIGDEGQITWTH